MFVNQVNRRDAVSFSRLRFRHHFFLFLSLPTYTQQRVKGGFFLQSFGESIRALLFSVVDQTDMQPTSSRVWISIKCLFIC